MIRFHQLARFLETVVVAACQPLEQDRHLPGTPRLRRWTPFPPRGIPVVEKQVVDDGGEERTQAAAALKLPQDAVVVLDELQLDVGPEVVGLDAREMVPRGNKRDHPLDELECGLEECLAVRLAGELGACH